MNNELVSIITPLYNAESYIENTIKSVQKQIYENWEMVIVNDCSNDGSEKIVKRLMSLDKRIKLINLEENQGVANARNVGIRYSKGRFIAFLDADDMWTQDKLNKQINFMLEKDIAFSFTGYELINSHGEKLNRVVTVPNVVNYKNLLKGNVIGCFTVIIDQSKCSSIEMPSIKHEDYATWLNVLKQGNTAFGFNETLGLYRRMPTSLTGNKFKSAKWTWNLYRNNQNLSTIKSLYFFMNYIIKGLKRHVL